MKIIKRVLIAFLLLISFSLVAEPMEVKKEGALTTSAILQNFLPTQLTGGNGMEPSKAVENEGVINTFLDVDGNAVQAIDEQDLRYFDGKYYLYGPTFTFGAFNHAAGVHTGPYIPTIPEESFYRYGGMAIYSSEDLMNWKLETVVNLQDSETGWVYPIKKPRVIYSEATDQYVLWFDNGQSSPENSDGYSSNIYRISTSKTPIGPWSEPTIPTCELDPTLSFVGMDYEFCLGPDGSYYWVCSHNGNQLGKLNKECTGFEEVYDPLPINYKGYFGGIGLFYRDGWWYITSSLMCGNCISAPMVYVMARNPWGPWISPDTMEEDDGKGVIPSFLTDNVGYAQVHSAKSVPDLNGNPQLLIPATHYRSSVTGAPGDGVSQPGDNNLALAGHFYFTVEFEEDGRIKPLKLGDSSEIELAHAVVTTVPKAYEAQLSITKDESVKQEIMLEEGETLSALLPSVFQRTPDNSTSGTRGSGAYFQEPHCNQNLDATLTLSNGVVYRWSIDYRTVRWAPTKVVLPLPEPYKGKGKAVLELSTKATNGGYGVAVCEKDSNSDLFYSWVKDGEETIWPKAEMRIEKMCDMPTIPVITRQPTSLVVEEGMCPSFYVEYKGEGVGFQWLKNGKVIYAPDGWNESDTPVLRLQDVTKEDEGTYSVCVFNSLGAVYSVPVTLDVIEK